MLQISKLMKSYGLHQALKGLDLTVGEGEVFCLLGQNGAGKTTTINICLGFLRADSGEVSINGKAVEYGRASSRKPLAYIPEVVMLYPQLSALENLDFFCRLAGYRYTVGRLSEFLSEANLQPEAHQKRVKAFSKGMRQKVGIAIAVAKRADVILMDEPTSGLDPRATDEFTRVVKRLTSDGKSVLMATHDIFNAVNVGTHIGIMKEGKLVHTLGAASVTPDALQQLYLETI